MMNQQELDVCNKVGLTLPIIDKHNITAAVANFDAGSILFKPGDSCQAFLILCQGSIRVEMTTKSGRDLTLYKVKPSESCISTTTALLNDERYYTQGIAESDISAIALSVDHFYKAVQHSNKFTRYVLASYAARISSVVRLVDRKAGRDVMLDLTQYLVSSIDQNMVIEVTQSEIAKDIGTAREVVGRKLSALEQEGVVTLKRGLILVKDIKQLKNIAEM